MPDSPSDRPVIVADIGGTNTRVALADGPRLVPGSVERVRNADHPGVEPILSAYLSRRGLDAVPGACVAVAGPVTEGQARLTNFDWTMDLGSIRTATGADHVALLNDLQAQGHAVGHIAADDLQTVFRAEAPVPGATALVIGAGTGFNAAPVFVTRAGRFVPPAEAGHVNLPARGAEMRGLVQHLEDRFGFASVEDALSGRGLVNLHRWAAEAAGAPPLSEAAAIVAAGHDGDPVAERAIAMFVQVFGLSAGNLALQTLPYGGIYLIGGVARGVAPWFDRFGFAEAFHDKGRFTGFVQAFRVQLVTDDYAALTGCASHLSEVMTAR